MESYLTPWDVVIAAQGGDMDAMFMMAIFCSQRMAFEAGAVGKVAEAAGKVAEAASKMTSAAGGAENDNLPKRDGAPGGMVTSSSVGIIPNEHTDLISAFGDMTLNVTRPASESDARAYYWFRRAAEAGHIASMPSLAYRLKKGLGCPVDRREARDWYARGADLGCKVSKEAFFEDSLLAREAMAIVDMFKDVVSGRKVPYGHKVPVHNPNMHGLIMAVGVDRLKETGYKSLFYGKHCAELDRLMKESELKIQYVAARAGTSKEYPDQAAAKQPIEPLSPDAFVYRAGSFRGISELPLSTEIHMRRWRNAMPPYLNICTHISDDRPISACSFCLLDAKRRLLAISFGQYALSIAESRPGAGYGAVWLDFGTGEWRRDPFKAYCRSEVEFVMKQLGKSGWGYLHPFHIAQDPSLVWPMVHYYGSVRMAIELVCGSLVSWTHELGPVVRVERDNMPPVPTPEGAEAFILGPDDEGRTYNRCGADGCTKFEGTQGTTKFSVCGKCKRKRYCSRECQVGDWSAHKKECGAL
ncbi:hypothetical protein HK104_004516 [Borealophlyctis nickersoniae]|nr:hypothetical protein HK104_004516 [Borealophlyctis nickersoniae]